MIHRIITTFFGLGYSPIAPGTFGAGGGILVFYILYLLEVGPIYLNSTLIILIILFFFLGIHSTNKLIPIWGKDPSKVVVDETIGQWITLLCIPYGNHWYVLLAFILFRFFDISKILGIRKFERLHGGLGVMMDDVVAGIYGAIILQIIIKFELF